MKKYYFILWLVFTCNLYSQQPETYPEYLITSTFDTVNGNIDIIKEGSKIRFTDANGTKTYKAEEIAGFKKGLYHYKTVFPEEFSANIQYKPVFLRIIEKGEVTLYQLEDPLFNNNTTYYLQRNGIISEAENLQEYFKDYLELATGIENDCYTKKDIVEITCLFNIWHKTGINLVPEMLSDKKHYGFSPGYVIEKETNDTIQGYLKLTSSGSQLLLYDKELLLRTYHLIKNGDEILGYSINNRTYKRIISGVNTFIREYAYGKISLYSVLQENPVVLPYQTKSETIKRVYYLLSEHDDKPVEVKTWKLAEYFSDNRVLVDMINKGYYDITDIESMVNIYNTTSE